MLKRTKELHKTKETEKINLARICRITLYTTQHPFTSREECFYQQYYDLFSELYTHNTNNLYCLYDVYLYHPLTHAKREKLQSRRYGKIFLVYATQLLSAVYFTVPIVCGMAFKVC